VADRSRLTVALLVSALLHALSLGAGFSAWPRGTVMPSVPPLLDVDLVPFPEMPEVPTQDSAPPQAPQPLLLPETQIVSPPDAGEERAPESTRLLSDRDNTVNEEMVRRGSPGAAEDRGEETTFFAGDDSVAQADVDEPPPLPAPAAPEAGEVTQRAEAIAAESKDAEIGDGEEPVQVAALPKLEELLPRAGDVAALSPTPAETEPRSAPQERKSLLAASGRGISSRPGITDYLPTIQEGDITLLNTKADLFAPFVRRVGARVFQHLEMRLRQASRRGASGRGREFAQIEAVMSQEGRLLDARVIKRHSDTSLAAYRELLAVTRPEIFFDANPPPGAEASDGNIHFILQVELSVDVAVNRRTAAPSTAYYGVISVGLI
jgi:hypothetical protein